MFESTNGRAERLRGLERLVGECACVCAHARRLRRALAWAGVRSLAPSRALLLWLARASGWRPWVRAGTSWGRAGARRDDWAAQVVALVVALVADVVEGLLRWVVLRLVWGRTGARLG